MIPQCRHCNATATTYGRGLPLSKHSHTLCTDCRNKLLRLRARLLYGIRRHFDNHELTREFLDHASRPGKPDED